MTSSSTKKPPSGIDREQLRLEIIRETGINVSPDDAILTLIASHDIVLKSYEERWHIAVDRIERLVRSTSWILLSAMLVSITYFSFLAWVVS